MTPRVQKVRLDYAAAGRKAKFLPNQALGLAVADSVVRNVTAYDQPEVTGDLLAYIDSDRQRHRDRDQYAFHSLPT
jgi:hypothetical protein